jgi:formamidopyrimidine-DNA glycosylase
MVDKGEGFEKELRGTAGLRIACKICASSMLRQTQGADLYYYCHKCQRAVQIKL